MRFHSLCLVLTVVLCSVAAYGGGPKYKKPDVAVPQNWQSPFPWQQANPLDSLTKNAWWKIFGDSELDQYEDRAMDNNQTLKAAAARLAEARAFARVTASGLYPELDAGASAQRQRLSANRATNGGFIPRTAITQNTFAIPFTLNYEIDLFGRVRHSVEAANASLQASAADRENIRLLVTPQLPAIYFQFTVFNRARSVYNYSL